MRAVPRDLLPLPSLDVPRRDGRHVSQRVVGGQQGRRASQKASRFNQAFQQAERLVSAVNDLGSGLLSKRAFDGQRPSQAQGE
eukprot:388563-Karenia_brevis.AAC.1